MEIITFVGKPGSGKTYSMLEVVKENALSSFVILSPTHSGVNNIVDMLGEKWKDNVKTVHSYFRITPSNCDTEYINGPVDFPKCICFDEAGLIEKDLFERCMELIERRKSKHYILITIDPLQLPPIRCPSSIKFVDLEYWTTLIGNAMIIRHLYSSVISSKYIMESNLIQLGESKRFEQNVKELLKCLEKCNSKLKFEYFAKANELEGLIRRGYVVISSRYKILQKYYDEFHEDDVELITQDIPFSLGYKRLYIGKGSKIITTRNTCEYNNGDEFMVMDVDGDTLICRRVSKTRDDFVKIVKESVIFKDKEYVYFPISPSNFITVHKSQGRSIPNCLVITDEMFLTGMLYVAITRCRKDLKLYGSDNTFNYLIGAYEYGNFTTLSYVLERHLRWISSGRTKNINQVDVMDEP